MLGRPLIQGFVDTANPQAQYAGNGVNTAVKLAAATAAEAPVLAGTRFELGNPVFAGYEPEPHLLHRRAGRERATVGAPALAAVAQGNRADRAIVFKTDIATQATTGVHGAGLTGSAQRLIQAR